MTHTEQKAGRGYCNECGLEVHPTMLCKCPFRQQKSRAELIEEIVGECRAYFKDSETTSKFAMKLHFENFLRTSLLRISDASMDAVEVEKYKEEWKSKETPIGNGAMSHWNAAITASQEKRTLFTK